MIHQCIFTVQVSMATEILNIQRQRELLRFLCFELIRLLFLRLPNVVFLFWPTCFCRTFHSTPWLFIIMRSWLHWILIFREICILGQRARSFLQLHRPKYFVFSLDFDKWYWRLILSYRIVHLNEILACGRTCRRIF